MRLGSNNINYPDYEVSYLSGNCINEILESYTLSRKLADHLYLKFCVKQMINGHMHELDFEAAQGFVNRTVLFFLLFASIVCCRHSLIILDLLILSLTPQ